MSGSQDLTSGSGNETASWQGFGTIQMCVTQAEPNYGVPREHPHTTTEGTPTATTFSAGPSGQAVDSLLWI